MVTKTVEQAWAIGTILESSWGYDQTNVEFYEVVGYTPSNKSVKLRSLSLMTVAGSEGFMSDKVLPSTNTVSDIFTRRILTKYDGKPQVKIHYSSYASEWDGTPKYRSWYAWN